MPEPKLVLEPSDMGLEPMTVGRYALHRQIARGGMATIHIARLMGDEGFSRIVAAKRLHPEFAEDAEFVAMFLDEARIASKVQHRNVVPVLDVVTAGEEVILVQEYVHGAPLQWLMRSTPLGRAHVPINIAVSIACQILSGLHATHETLDELGQPMHIVHRDVSPQNVMIAVDGTARLLDFGVAKAVMAAHVTREGTYKGKLAYSAPEQLRGAATRQSDVYSLSVLLWELLVGHRMHGAKSGSELVESVVNGARPSLREALEAEDLWDSMSSGDRRQLQTLDPVVRRGLAVDLRSRWATAADMEVALSEVARPASPSVVAAWLKNVGKDFIERREGVIAAEEASWRRSNPVGSGRTLQGTTLSSIKIRVPTTSARPAEVARSQFHAPRNPRLLFAVLCSMIAALSLGVVLLARDAGTQRRVFVEAGPPRVTAMPFKTSEAPVVTPERASEPDFARPWAPAPEIHTPLEAPVTEVEPVTAPQNTDTPRDDRVQEVRDRPARRTRVASAARPSEQPAPPAQSHDATPPPSAKPSGDCATPYYFQGTKKIFKPACL